MIYLDNVATSPVDEEVLEAMLPYLKEEYGNPSSKYYCKAVNSKNAVEQARENVSRLINAKFEEIVFTSGATESTNFIIKGYMDYSKYYGNGKNHIITSKAEHKATLNVCKYLNGEIYSNNDATISLLGNYNKIDRGYNVTFLDVQSNGTVSPNSIKDSIIDNTAMVSIMYVNNEIGSINDIKTISKICNDKNIAFHTDVTQAIGKLPIDVKEISCDFMSFSAHKIYGPKGIGCAFLKSDSYGIPPITSLLHGGEQENGLRGSTLSVHDIVGFGKACEIALRDIEKNNKKISQLDEYFLTKIQSISDIYLVNNSNERLKGIISILVDRTNFNNERFIKKISPEIAISTGSACSIGEPSHVISAIGKSKDVSKVLRVSLSKYSTKNDIDEFIKYLTK